MRYSVLGSGPGELPTCQKFEHTLLGLSLTPQVNNSVAMKYHTKQTIPSNSCQVRLNNTPYLKSYRIPCYGRQRIKFDIEQTYELSKPLGKIQEEVQLQKTTNNNPKTIQFKVAHCSQRLLFRISYRRIMAAPAVMAVTT